MIKLLKLASYLSIALAVSTVVYAGIEITRDNETVRERAEILDESTIIEELRKLKILKTDKNKTSPLVTEAMKFAKRITPVVINRPPLQPPRKNKMTPNGTRVPTRHEDDRPERPATFKLVATCRSEKFPEKSLAMLDVTSKGLLWFRQGDMLGPNKIEKIEDGRIILLQRGKRVPLDVPKKNTVSSLLKGNGNTFNATGSPSDYRTSEVPPGKRGYLPPRAGSGYNRINRTARKQPDRPTPEEARKAAAKSAAELKNIMDDVKSDGKKSDQEILMESVMKLLEATSKKAPPKKGSSK